MRKYFHFDYGYLWWFWDKSFNQGAYKRAYFATRAYGQFITVVPELHLVVAFKIKYEYRRQTSTDLYFRFFDKLIAARKNNLLQTLHLAIWRGDRHIIGLLQKILPYLCHAIYNSLSVQQ